MKTEEQMEKLLHSGRIIRGIIRGYVYQNGSRDERWFQETPENIASFIGQHSDADHMILTDMLDLKVLDTIGTFIDSCPDKVLLEEIKKYLIPIQLGEAEPKELFSPTIQEVNTYYERLERQEMVMQ